MGPMAMKKKVICNTHSIHNSTIIMWPHRGEEPADSYQQDGRVEEEVSDGEGVSVGDDATHLQVRRRR